MQSALKTSDQVVAVVCAGVYVVALVAMLLTGWSSDRTGERRRHSGAWLLVSAAGFTAAAALNGSRPFLVIAVLTVIGAAVHSYLPPFWALPTTFLTGTAAAAAIGLINSIGNLGGFLGPYVIGYVTERSGSPSYALLFIAVLALAAGGLLVGVRFPNAPAAQSAERAAAPSSAGRVAP